MKFDDNHPAIFSILGGCIIVVLAGVAISLLVDRRFGFARNMTELQREIATGQSDLEQLRAAYQEYLTQAVADDSKLRRADESHQSLVRQLRGLDQRRSALEASREELQTALAAITAEFRRYRQQYRDKTWAEAAGESLGDLKIRGGSEYHQAWIVRVTDVGLEIHHAEGTARVHAPDLDAALQERFQWNDEERRARLTQEQSQEQATPRSPATPLADPAATKPSPPASRDPAEPDATKLKILRNRVQAGKTKVAQLIAARNEAVNAASRREKSVPGSLETWQNRAIRMDNELAGARAELAANQALLNELQPGDPLRTP